MSEAAERSVFGTAKWIWFEGKQKKNDLCIFRRVVNLEKKPKNLVMRIAADTHYYLNINNKFVVFEGGINHPAYDGSDGYYDEIDVGKYIKAGANAIVITCRYNGNSGSDSIDRRAGLIAELVSNEGVVACTDSGFDVYRNESNKDVEEQPTVNFAGFSHCYDATIERPLAGIYLPTFNSNIFVKAEEICSYGEEPFGELAKRPIPQYVFNQKLRFGKKAKSDKDNATLIYTMSLPRAMYIYPSLVCKALGMEKIKIYSDRTKTFGDFGDKESYTAPHIEYVCKTGKQLFESFAGIYGQDIYFEAPKSVKVAKLGYRFVEYDSEARGSFSCSDAQIDTLSTKCVNTLKSCMTDKLINNPERDRAMTLDSANIAVRSMLKVFDSNAHMLIKKTLAEVFESIEDGTIYSNIPGGEPQEIPSSGLLTISELGMFAAYSNYFSDMDAEFLPVCVDYLKKWDVEGGLIVPRGGWFDNLFNIDAAVLENCLYYSALNFAKRLAERTANEEAREFVSSRLEGFVAAFEDKFFNGLGYSSHPDYSDDRANAFAVLTGLCREENYTLLSDLIVSTQNASPYLESFVIEALCAMGKNKYARNRMASRYSVMSESNSSTLSEEFCIGGTQTASRSTMPLTVLQEYFGGVKITDGGTKITITPDLGDLEQLTFNCLTPKGSIKGEYRHTKDDNYEYIIHNDSKTEATVNLKAIGSHASKTYKIGRGKYKYNLQ